MLIARPEERQPGGIRFTPGIAIGRRRAAACRLVPPGIEALIGRERAAYIGCADDTSEPVLQVSCLRRTRAVGRAGEPQQRFIDVAAVDVSRRRVAADAAVPLGMDGVAVIEVAGGRRAGCLADPP